MRIQNAIIIRLVVRSGMHFRNRGHPLFHMFAGILTPLRVKMKLWWVLCSLRGADSGCVPFTRMHWMDNKPGFLVPLRSASPCVPKIIVQTGLAIDPHET